MKKFIVSSLMASLGLAAFSVSNSSYAAEVALKDTDISSQPVNLGLGNPPPLIMLLMGRDHSMYYEAYNDMTDLDGDGEIDGMFTPHVVYDGIFEANWCYTYNELKNGSSGYFGMTKPATEDSFDNGKYIIYKCGGSTWSGNFLNYLTSTRMDVVKRILIGGQRYANFSVCNTSAQKHGSCRITSQDNKLSKNLTYPVLARQFIPRDTHAWAKSYNAKDMDNLCYKRYGLSKCNFKLSDFAYFSSGTPDSAMFGSVGRQLYVIAPDPNSNTYQIGSYVDLAKEEHNHLYVWNWVARESGDGGSSGKAKGVLAYENGLTPVNNPDGSGNISVLAQRYFVLAEACHYSFKENEYDMPARCKNYGSELNPYYNTIGLLQDFSKSGSPDAYFGLITSTWSNKFNTAAGTGKGVAERGAALRAPIADLSSDNYIDTSTGEFKVDSVYYAIDLLSLSEKENTPGSTGSNGTSNTWPDCQGNWDNPNRKNTPARGCGDWGNPLLPMIQKSYDYFNNVATKSEDKDFVNGTVYKLRINSFTDNKNAYTFTYPNLSLDKNKTPYEKFDYCYKPINFILADESVSMDSYIGSSSSEQIDEGYEVIDKGEQLTGVHVFGELADGENVMELGNEQTVHSQKKVVNLSDMRNVRGVSTLEPYLQGTLNGAALAQYIHSHPMSHKFGGVSKNVPGFEHYAVAMASYLPKFEIYAYNGKKALFVPTCFSPVIENKLNMADGIGAFSYDGESGHYTNSCGIMDVFYINSKYDTIDGQNRMVEVEFRVTYEDNESGSDLDMDASFAYKIEADKNNPNILTVTVTGFYHDTYAGQIGGYNIFGTAGSIEPYEGDCANPGDWICGIKTYKVNAKKTLYLDVMKVDQNSNNFTLMKSNSDPFNEYNNDVGYDDATEFTSAPSTSKVKVVPKSDVVKADHRKGCLEGKQARKIVGETGGRYFRFSKDGSWIQPLKFLPAFSKECNLAVERKFYVTGLDNAIGFYDSPLDYAAYYGSKYGDNGNKEKRRANNPNYFYVTNASQLASQITAALTKAVGDTGNSGSGLSFPSLDVTDDNTVVTAVYDSQYWTGQLVRKTLKYNADGSVDLSAQSPGSSTWTNDEALFDDETRYLIADKTGALTDLTADLLADTASVYPLSQAAINTMGLELCNDEHKKEFFNHYVAYIKGSAEWEIDQEEGDVDYSLLTPHLECAENNNFKFYGFHPRSSVTSRKSGGKFGAIISSTPQYYNAGSKKKIIFAANDGMVYIVDYKTGHVDYSIIPYVTQSFMPKYAEVNNKDHYINDGKMTVNAYKEGGVDKVLVIGTLGYVHPGVYALDLSGDEPVMRWELSPYYIRENTDEVVRNMRNLGGIQAAIKVYPYSVSYNNSSSKMTLYAIFGNGYNSQDGVSGVAVVDAITGRVMSKFDGQKVSGDIVTKSIGGVLVNDLWGRPDCNRSPEYAEYKTDEGECYKNGMNQVAAYDKNFDFKPDYIYSTDLYGNVYRIRSYVADSTSTGNISVHGWTVARIHTTVSPADSAGKYLIQPITTAPSLLQDVKGNPMVAVGTGKYLGVSDVSNTVVQSVWALSDSSYASSDAPIKNVCPVDPLEVKYCRANGRLYKSQFVQPDSSEDLPPNYVTIKEPEGVNAYGAYDVDHYSGWVLDFNTVAPSKITERVKNNMRAFDNHLYVTTLIPSKSECEGGGVSRWYDLNVVTSTFYVSAKASQEYYDTVLNETNFAYTRDNNNDPAGGTGGTGGSDKDGIRDRVNWHYGCATGLAGFSGAKGEASVKKLDSICPKVESWQFIYN